MPGTLIHAHLRSFTAKIGCFHLRSFAFICVHTGQFERRKTMASEISRRELLSAGAAAAITGMASSVHAQTPSVMPADGPKKAVLFPKPAGKLSIQGRMKLARGCGAHPAAYDPVTGP